MNWQTRFPNHLVSLDQKNPDLALSFGESSKEYQTLLRKVVISTDYRGLLLLSGPGSEEFLQGQVTCDLGMLETGRSMKGAHLSPKGRVIFLFTVSRDKDNNLLLETHPSLVGLAIDSLKKYSIFFKTEISDASDRYINVILSGPGSKSILEGIKSVVSYELASSVFAITLDKETSISEISDSMITVTPAGQGFSDLLRIRSGYPEVTIESTGEFIVQMINLDALNFISFKKGCYTGQEIVARAHYRGTVKRRMYLLDLNTTSLPDVGESLINTSDKVIGHVVNSAISSDKTIQILATIAVKSADTNQIKFDSYDLIDITCMSLPYEIPTRP